MDTSPAMASTSSSWVIRSLCPDRGPTHRVGTSDGEPELWFQLACFLPQRDGVRTRCGRLDKLRASAAASISDPSRHHTAIA